MLNVVILMNFADERKIGGDRNIGQAEAQLAKLSCNIVYDISLDTFERSMEECADIIIRQIDNIDLCTAFQKK